MKIMPNYFLVRVNKEEQRYYKERMSKHSLFFMPIDQRFNSRNMEYGDILQIGSSVTNIEGWENCQPGHILNFHHTIEQEDEAAIKHYCIDEDEEYKYYAVDEKNVRGYYDGKELVPHPKFVYLKNIQCFEDEGEIDNNGNVLEKEGILYVIKNWSDNPSNIAKKSQKIKEHIESLAKNTRTDEIQHVMEGLEKERIALNRKAQRRYFLPYRLAWAHPNLSKEFGIELKEDSVLFCLNRACLYVSNFQIQPYTYIICPIDYVGALINN